MDKKEKIIEFIQKHIGPRRKPMTSSTTIENDLRITGDEAYELIDDFVAEFDLDADGFEYNRYFNEEGFDPIGLSILIKKLLRIPSIKKSKHQICIDDLEAWVERGYWVDPEEAS